MGNNALVLVKDLPSNLQPLLTTIPGMEHIPLDVFLTPRIELVQGQTGVLKKSNPDHIPGIAQGENYNTANLDCYGSGFTFVLLFSRISWFIWLDRDEAKNSGYRGEFRSKQDAVQAKAALPEKEQRIAEIVKTPQAYVLVLPDDENQESCVALMNFPSSKEKPFGQLMTRSASWTRYSGFWNTTIRCESVEINGQKGDYFNWAFRKGALIDPESELAEAVMVRRKGLIEMDENDALMSMEAEHEENDAESQSSDEEVAF